VDDVVAVDDYIAPASKISSLKCEKKCTSAGMSTYVEKFIYSRRKNAAKRKLVFDVDGGRSSTKIKVEKSGGCDDN
jgi:hypothetical protein